MKPLNILFFILVLWITGVGHAYAVHDVVGKVKCLDCHSKLPFPGTKVFLTENVGTICTGCHAGGGRMSEAISHPVNVVPSMAVPRDLPVDAHGRMTCITCHTFHEGYRDTQGNKRFFLRRQRGKTFCYTCHKRL